jgi:hypothetical protein
MDLTPKDWSTGRMIPYSIRSLGTGGARRDIRNAILDLRLVCEIKVKNHMDACRTGWLGDLSTAKLDNGEVFFSGTVPVQAALFGLLNKMQDLNILR